MREVVLGADPPIAITRRAAGQLAEVREQMSGTVDAEKTVITRVVSGDVRWWTWAGYRANATLASTLGTLVDPSQGFEDLYVRLRKDLTVTEWQQGIKGCDGQLCLPSVNDKALAGLKFSTALPRRLAEATLAARLADLPGALEILRAPVRFTIT
jgi:ATP-dependent Lhr-like helicase